MLIIAFDTEKSSSTTVLPWLIILVTNLSYGITPTKAISRDKVYVSIFRVNSIFVSYLLTQTAVFVLKILAVLRILSRSEIPDKEGSATIKTMSTPDSEAITGQPIPGDPSMITRSSFVRLILFNG